MDMPKALPWGFFTYIIRGLKLGCKISFMRAIGYKTTQYLFFVLSLVCAMVMNSSAAFAVPGFFGGLNSCGGGADGGGPLSGTIGGLICNLGAQFSMFPYLFDLIAYIAGLGFMTWGILKAVKHVDAPSQVPISDSIKFIIAAAFFLTAPTLVYYLLRTFGLDSAYSAEATGFASIEGGEEGTLDHMLGSFAANIYSPMLFMFRVFTFIAGIIVLLVAINRITKGFNEGPRGPLGVGTMMHFVLAAVLFATPQMLGAVTESIFGTNQIVTYAAVASTSLGLPEDISVRADTILTSVELFLIIIGIISFIRGWFLLKSATDGNSQASVMQAITHIIAGVIAVNIGPFMNAVQTTFGLGSHGMVFNAVGG